MELSIQVITNQATYKSGWNIRRAISSGQWCRVLSPVSYLLVISLLLVPTLLAQSKGAQKSLSSGHTMHITQRYLNIPISNAVKMQVFNISVDGTMKREIPLQLADGAVDYWIYIDVTEFINQTITLSGSATQAALSRIYQDDQIHDVASIYKEPNRPTFHFTVKRGWNNDINGPIFYHDQYHLFWQAYPFGVTWDVGFMYWGHAVSKDLIHWTELSPALMLDKLGSPWSGSSVVDHDNSAGWGRDALVLVYSTFDRATNKQVQSIAYSTDNGSSFTHYSGNPVLDTNLEVGSNDTRDPKVFWYQPTKHWVMVLFEKDGMSFFTSTDLKAWTRQSHLKGLYECPDFFELPVDGDISHKKWILHGGSANYVIGSFDGKTFTPESAELRYADGKRTNGEDVLYAAQSFEEMPDGRRVQIAWGRIKQEGMPFNQMMLFPTELKLVTTQDGLRMRTTPIREIEKLHSTAHHWSSLTMEEASRKLGAIRTGSLDVRFNVSLAKQDELSVRYNGLTLGTVKSGDLDNGKAFIELLIDQSVAELFVNGGERYIVREMPTTSIRRDVKVAHTELHGTKLHGTESHSSESNGRNSSGLELSVGQTTSRIDHLDVFEMKSMWSLNGVQNKRSR